MCGKRLKDWKTIPIRRRTRFSSMPGAVISSPPRTIRPASIGSSRLTQRRSVDFPDPEAPIRQTTSCGSSVRSMPFSTSALPNDLCRPSTASAALVIGTSGQLTAPVARDEPVGQARHRDGQEDEEERRHEVRRVVEGRRHLDLRLAERLDRPEERHQGRVLLKPDEVVQKRGHDAPHRLREDDEAQRLRARETERARGRLLARVHRVDAGAVDLRDVGRVDEHERRRCPRRAGRSARRRSAAAGTPNPRM